MNETKDRFNEELLNNETNFITRNSLSIIIVVAAAIIAGLSRINVPVYENVKLIFVESETDQAVFSIKNTNDQIFNKDETHLIFKENDTVDFISANGKQLSLVLLDQKNTNETLPLLKAINRSKTKEETLTKGEAIFGKIITGQENLVLSIISDMRK
jgi:hypothetical protein